MGKNLVHGLYKFLKEDVNEEQILEATEKRKQPSTEVIDIGEGKLPYDPSSDPEGYMGELREKDGGEVPPAEETDKNKETKLEKELDKETPELDKDPTLQKQAEQGKGKAPGKELKSAGVTNVEVVKGVEEGKVPSDPSSDNPENKGDLYEQGEGEKELTVVSDEETAKEIAGRYQGGRVVPDPQAKKYIVKVPESTEISEDEEDDDEMGEEMQEKDEPESAKELGYKNDQGDFMKEEVDEASGQQQAVPKMQADQGAQVDNVQKDKSQEANPDAKAQAGKPGAKSVDQQAVPKTDAAPDADVDDVATQAVPDKDLNPDATKKVGSPKASPVDGQQMKSAADQGADVEGVSKPQEEDMNPDAKKQAGSDGGKSVDQQSVPKTSVSQDARVDSVKTCNCGEACEGTCEETKEVEEGVDVAISTDDKDVMVSAQDGQTTITTSDKAEAVEEIPMEEPMVEEPPMEEPVEEEPPMEEEPVSDEEDEIIMSAESVQEMAEKLYLVKHLKEKKELTEKEKAFITATESVELSEKNKKLVDEKLAELQK